MKIFYPFALAAMIAVLMNAAPAYAFASRNPGSSHTHSQTAHDRTPTAHTHSTHSHHHG